MSELTTLPTPLELRTRTVGPWPMNAYAFVCPHTHHSVLIDPGADPDGLMARLAATPPTAILLTHTHADHLGALDALRQQLAVPLLAHPGPHVDDRKLALDRPLGDGDDVAVGQGTLRVYATPGHTRDMLCFADPVSHQIVVGDTLFAWGTCGVPSSTSSRGTMGRSSGMRPGTGDRGRRMGRTHCCSASSSPT